jgi:hypothetical protein
MFCFAAPWGDFRRRYAQAFQHLAGKFPVGPEQRNVFAETAKSFAENGERAKLEQGIREFPRIRIAPVQSVRLRRLRDRPRAHGNLHVHVLPELAEHFHETVDRETLQLGLAHAGEVGSRETSQFVGTPHRDALCVENADDLGGEDRLEL